MVKVIRLPMGFARVADDFDEAPGSADMAHMLVVCDSVRVLIQAGEKPTVEDACMRRAYRERFGRDDGPTGTPAGPSPPPV